MRSILRVGLNVVAVMGLFGTGAAMAAPDAKKPAVAKPVAPTKAGAGTAVVKDANEKIAKQLKDKAPAADVTKSVRAFLDIDELGKRAMATNWDKLTAAQQKDFQDTLRALIEANYVQGQQANLKYTVSYDSETTDAAGNVTVGTTITAQKNNRPFSIKVAYVLKKDSAGALRCWDVSTDGVGLVANYKTMFDSLMTKGGFANLIGKMKKKQAAMAAAPGAGGGAGTGGGGGAGTGGGGGSGAGPK